MGRVCPSPNRYIRPKRPDVGWRAAIVHEWSSESVLCVWGAWRGVGSVGPFRARPVLRIGKGRNQNCGDESFVASLCSDPWHPRKCPDGRHAVDVGWVSILAASAVRRVALGGVPRDEHHRRPAFELPSHRWGAHSFAGTVSHLSPPAHLIAGRALEEGPACPTCPACPAFPAKVSRRVRT